MIPIFRAKIENGELTHYSEETYNEYLKTLNGFVNVIVRKPSSKRSTQLNKYYWGVVVKLLGNELGLTAPEMHKDLKEQFIGLRKIDGDCLTSTKMSNKQFKDYLDEIKIFYAQQEIVIPDPNDVDYNTIEDFLAY